MLYSVSEIFYSIQGEGFHSGKPAVFLRLNGCNLHCPWCDTHPKTVESMTETEIYHRISNFIEDNEDGRSILIVITGGEPTIQDYAHLVKFLGSKFPYNTIAMETNGRVCHFTAMRRLQENENLWVTVSPKLGVENCWPYFENPLWMGNELKIVLDPKINPKVLINMPHDLRKRFQHFYIQPLSGDNEPAIKFVKENPQWALSIQLQKILTIR